MRQKTIYVKKDEVLGRIREITGMKRTEIDIVLSGFTEVVRDALMNGESIRLLNFGLFDTKITAPRIVSVPGTKERVEIPERRTPYFNFSSKFKEEFHQEREQCATVLDE